MSNFASGSGRSFAREAEEYFDQFGPSDVIVTPPLAAAIAAGAAVESAPQEVKFKEPGYVIMVVGQELAGTAAKFAMTEVRIQIGGSRDLFSDGRVGQFMPMLVLFGGVHNRFKLTRFADPSTSWFVTYRNRDGGATATPFTAFPFVSLRALGKGPK